jgi:hypothetical protein
MRLLPLRRREHPIGWLYLCGAEFLPILPSQFQVTTIMNACQWVHGYPVRLGAQILDPSIGQSDACSAEGGHGRSPHLTPTTTTRDKAYRHIMRQDL